MRFGTAIATLCLTAFTSATTNTSYISNDQALNAFNDTHFCKLDRNDNVSPSCNVTFNELNAINKNIRDDLSGLLKSDFFKYFRLDLYKQCSFWDANDGLCLNRACSVDVVEDWDKLPEYWQPEILGSFNNNTMKEADDNDDECKFLDQLCQTGKKPVNIEDTINYCDINDFNGKDAVLIDLAANPERFTGYGGKQAGQIWSTIYQDNCFTIGETGESLAKDAFYRLVSGFHASIGTHLSKEYLNTKTGKWEPNLDLFMARIGNFPDRVTNMYFNYAVVAKALWKIQPYLPEFSFCDLVNKEIKNKMDNVISQLDTNIFNEDLVFANDLSLTLKDEFRSRFKNVTKIMDCVQCDRCRLWGKIQTTGYATALKILFEINDADEFTKQDIVGKLTKYELIALLQTFGRLSESIESVNMFEKMYGKRLNGTENRLSSFFQNNFFSILKKAGKSIRYTIENINNTKQEKEENDSSQAHAFDDLKVPQPKSVSKPAAGVENKWKKGWNTEINNVLEAFNFIYRSYMDLPRNIWRLTMTNAYKFWNKFIGVADYVSEEMQEPISYKLDIK
ncbi:ER oxidoreductin SKDI_13G0090 [Saccharomyces kudriavzevii IFO 1802]|uniref:ERO1-like protein n=1 Tax=Saccharomyces kudriavzevii (strain ATCC MYA-4449 / AS 2.2408 / CBS 8840 / NBRC 1802 / NCYC 2889) TaxID=226230 RepID=A0AA35NKA8_SACK1|nr:uncharacterized protein SKDI_13G0090 [Saccharomyces kudriavzevii IFO 1802]CAI4047475.1 hypothetical protein SKDI_13G0090 [Saccharomyces kudriavzevii IFO 1802]